MNDKQSTNKKNPVSLEDRFARHPQVYARLQKIADLMDEALTQGRTADEAEAMVIAQIQKLGGELLGDWAREKQQHSVEQSQRENPSAIKHIKKK